MGFIDQAMHRAVARKLQHQLALWGHSDETGLMSEHGSGHFTYPEGDSSPPIRRLAVHVSNKAVYFVNLDAPTRHQMAIRIPYADILHAGSKFNGARFAVQTKKGTAVFVDFGQHAQGAGDVVMNQLEAFQRSEAS